MPFAFKKPCEEANRPNLIVFDLTKQQWDDLKDQFARVAGPLLPVATFSIHFPGILCIITELLNINDIDFFGLSQATMCLLPKWTLRSSCRHCAPAKLTIDIS